MLADDQAHSWSSYALTCPANYETDNPVLRELAAQFPRAELRQLG